MYLVPGCAFLVQGCAFRVSSCAIFVVVEVVFWHKSTTSQIFQEIMKLEKNATPVVFIIWAAKGEVFFFGRAHYGCCNKTVGWRCGVQARIVQGGQGGTENTVTVVGQACQRVGCTVFFFAAPT